MWVYARMSVRGLRLRGTLNQQEMVGRRGEGEERRRMLMRRPGREADTEGRGLPLSWFPRVTIARQQRCYARSLSDDEDKRCRKGRRDEDGSYIGGVTILLLNVYMQSTHTCSLSFMTITEDTLTNVASVCYIFQSG